MKKRDSKRDLELLFSSLRELEVPELGSSFVSGVMRTVRNRNVVEADSEQNYLEMCQICLRVLTGAGTATTALLTYFTLNNGFAFHGELQTAMDLVALLVA